MHVGIAAYVQGHPFEARDGKRCWLRRDVFQLQSLQRAVLYLFDLFVEAHDWLGRPELVCSHVFGALAAGGEAGQGLAKI